MTGAEESLPDTSPTLFDMAMYEVATERWPTPNVRDYKDVGENTNYEKLAAKSKLAGVVVSRQLISSAAVSPASPSPTLAGGWEPKTNAGSGLSSCESYARLGPDGCWLRMYQDSFQLMMDGSLEECLGTWPRAGSMWNGTAYQRPPLVPRTSAIGSFSLPTPTAVGMQRGSKDTRPHGNLHDLARTGLWPTPSVPSGGRTLPEGTTRRGMTPEGKKRQVDLGQVVKRWPTPTQADGMGGPGSSGRDGGENLRTQVGGALNADWVGILMGFPADYTKLEDE